MSIMTLLAYYWQCLIKTGPIYNSEKSLEGKTVVITGGNSGIGRVTAIEIAKRNANLIIASRNLEKSEAVKQEIETLTGNKNIKVLKLDLEDFNSVQDFANNLKNKKNNIDFLINNAGSMFMQGLTKHGYSRVFTVNHLGHFLLTTLILENMKQQSYNRPVRIINLSSVMYKFGTLNWDELHYDPQGLIENFKAYSDSKLANIYFTSELHTRLKDYNITSFAVHPGIIASDIGNNIFKLPDFLYKAITFPFLRKPIYGAQTVLYTMLDDNVITQSGRYFVDCKLETLWNHATNQTVGSLLWEKSLQLVGV